MMKNEEEEKKNNSHHHHHHRRSLSFQLHIPHLSHDREKAAGMPPKGCMAIRVGQEGQEQQRFVVPVAHLNHPLFAKLLEEAEKEYGFHQKGAIAIPCRVDHFRHVQDLIGRECGGGAAAASAGHGHHHNDHHHRQHSHHHLPHFAACFGA